MKTSSYFVLLGQDEINDGGLNVRLYLIYYVSKRIIKLSNSKAQFIEPFSLLVPLLWPHGKFSQPRSNTLAYSKRCE